MSVIMTVFYPLWYRAYRSRINETLVNDTVAAKTLLDEIITEHDIVAINDPEENSHLHHARDHLNAFQNTDQQVQKDATTRALDEE